MAAPDGTRQLGGPITLTMKGGEGTKVIVPLTHSGLMPRLDLDLDACLRIWETAMALSGSGEAVALRWLHGDLLAENLLVRNRRLAAVLDFDSLSLGDPTVDLIVAWEVFDPRSRELFRSLLGVDVVTWLRGRAWALAIALITFPYYWQTLPERWAARLAMARAVLADAAPLLQNGG